MICMTIPTLGLHLFDNANLFVDVHPHRIRKSPTSSINIVRQQKGQEESKDIPHEQGVQVFFARIARRHTFPVYQYPIFLHDVCQNAISYFSTYRIMKEDLQCRV